MAGAVNLLWHTSSIIHHDFQEMLARLHLLWQKIALRSRDEVAGIHQFSIHIHPCRSGTLQEEFYRLLLPVLRDIDGSGISCSSFIGIESRKMRCFHRIFRSESQMVRIDGTGKNGTLHLTLRGTLTLGESATALSQLHIPFTSERNALCLQAQTYQSQTSDKNRFLHLRIYRIFLGLNCV